VARMTSRRLALAASAVLALAPVHAHAADAPASPDLVPGEAVKIERTKPAKPKLPTLRFLQANKDFLRVRLDALRTSTIERAGGAEPVDPRFLAYGAMKGDVLAAGDSVAAARDARLRSDLYAEVADLTALDRELDGLETALAAQRARLATLEADFTGRQPTALIVVLRGSPAARGLTGIAFTTEDGTVHRVPLTPAQLDALVRGGVAQAVHVYVEPREQALAITLDAAEGATPPAWIALDPVRDRITLLEIDLSALGASLDATALRARAWTHEPDTRSAAR